MQWFFTNPNLPPNDSLTPEQIQEKVDQRNGETRELTNKAYQAGGVPPSAADRAAKHSSITRQTAEAKKDRRDASTWREAKSDGGDNQCQPTMHLTSVSGSYNWEDDDDD